MQKFFQRISIPMPFRITSTSGDVTAMNSDAYTDRIATMHTAVGKWTGDWPGGALGRRWRKTRAYRFGWDRRPSPRGRERRCARCCRRATPVAADRSMPVLSVIMREVEAMGLRPEGSNPCQGIRRYRREGRHPEQVAVVRLLLLTGCRKGEILTLRWSDYREGHLFLRDSKTGPRTVWLSEPARNILDALERKGSWVFPACGARPASRTCAFTTYAIP